MKYFILSIKIIKDDVFTLIQETENENVLTIFPNPTTGFIQFGNLLKTKNVDVIITDVFGNKVFSRKNLNVNEQIDLTHLTNGHYFVSFSIDSYTKVRKIVKFGS